MAKKIFSIIKRRNFLFAFAVAAAVIIALGWAAPAHAGAGGLFGGVVFWIIRQFIDLLSIFTTWAMMISGTLLDYVTSANFNNQPLTHGGIVDIGWPIVRDFANMFFIIILLASAFATMLNLENYNIRKILPTLVVVALLVNFTKVIAGLFVDAAQVIMIWFLTTEASGGGSIALTLVHGVGLGQFFTLNDYAISQMTFGQSQAAQLVNSIAYLVFSGYFAMILFFLSVMLILRIAVLWVLVIFAPLAFVSYILPNAKFVFDNWWKYFLNYTFFGPIMAFFLFLAVIIAVQIGNLQQWTGYKGSEAASMQSNFLTGPFILQYLVVIIFLQRGYKFSQQMSIWGSDWGAKQMNKVGDLAKFAAKGALGASTRMSVPMFSRLRNPAKMAAPIFSKLGNWIPYVGKGLGKIGRKLGEKGEAADKRWSEGTSWAQRAGKPFIDRAGRVRDFGKKAYEKIMDDANAKWKKWDDLSDAEKQALNDDEEAYNYFMRNKYRVKSRGEYMKKAEKEANEAKYNAEEQHLKKLGLSRWRYNLIGGGLGMAKAIGKLEGWNFGQYMAYANPDVWKSGWKNWAAEQDRIIYGHAKGKIHDTLNNVFSLGRRKTNYAMEGKRRDVEEARKRLEKTTLEPYAYIDHLVKNQGTSDEVRASLELLFKHKGSSIERQLFNDPNVKKILRGQYGKFAYDKNKINSENVMLATAELLSNSGLKGDDLYTEMNNFGRQALAVGKHDYLFMGTRLKAKENGWSRQETDELIKRYIEVARNIEPRTFVQDLKPDSSPMDLIYMITSESMINQAETISSPILENYISKNSKGDLAGLLEDEKVREFRKRGVNPANAIRFIFKLKHKKAWDSNSEFHQEFIPQLLNKIVDTTDNEIRDDLSQAFSNIFEATNPKEQQKIIKFIDQVEKEKAQNIKNILNKSASMDIDEIKKEMLKKPTQEDAGAQEERIKNQKKDEFLNRWIEQEKEK